MPVVGPSVPLALGRMFGVSYLGAGSVFQPGEDNLLLGNVTMVYLR